MASESDLAIFQGLPWLVWGQVSFPKLKVAGSRPVARFPLTGSCLQVMRPVLLLLLLVLAIVDWASAQTGRQAEKEADE